MYPEETTKDESEKEQRVEDCSHEADESGDAFDNDQRMAELQAEWVLLLHALDMDTSSQLTDVLSEVMLRVCGTVWLTTSEKYWQDVGHDVTMQVETRLAHLPGGGMTDSLLKTSLTTEQWVCHQVRFKFITVWCNMYVEECMWHFLDEHC